MRKPVILTASLVAALALAGCQAEETETSLEVDATDMSGGELIATPADEEAVAVDLPETPMTPEPEAAASAAPE